VPPVPRQQQPPTTQPQSAPPASPTGQIAALPAGELLPLAALGVGAPAVPITAAAIGVALAKALAAIVAAFDTFEQQRTAEAAVRLRQTLTTLYPERTPEEVEQLVRSEVELERIFQRKQKERLERDLPDALRIESPEERRARVQAILERERRYIQMREQAMLDRASARATHMSVKAVSPEGAYWQLSRFVSKHTPACVAFAGRFWPWEVLDKYHPRIHAGCACTLISKQEAVRRGLMHPDQVPDVKDAVKRATEIARTEEEMRHYGVTESEVAEHLALVYAEPLARSLAEAGYALRYAKGTEKGGEFRPKIGGTPGRATARKLLRKLVPHRALSPAERRRTGVGQWREVGGRRVFIPEHRAWARTLGGRRFSSPPGSTHVYEQPPGSPGPKSPAPTMERAQELRNMVRSKTVDSRSAATVFAQRALEAQDPNVLPAELGAPMAATHRGLLDTGMLIRDIHPQKDGGSRVEYVHAATQSGLTVGYRDGKVTSVRWRPSGSPMESAPLLQGRPPEDFEEFINDLYSHALALAAEHGQDVRITRVRTDHNLADHEGMHEWDGTVALGVDIQPAIETLAAAHAAGRPLTDEEARDVYWSVHTAVHEGIHSVNSIKPQEFTDMAQRALEEGLTEELSPHEAVKMLRRWGAEDVLTWLKGHQPDGNYRLFRDKLGKVLDKNGLAPEDRLAMIEHLKYEVPSPHRVSFLADEGGDEEHIRSMLAVGGVSAAEYEPFRPLTRPDLSDVPDMAPVEHQRQPLVPGLLVMATGSDGAEDGAARECCPPRRRVPGDRP
jgi:hypothetical protein